MYWLETSGNASARLIYQFIFSSPTQFGLLMCFSTAYFSLQYTKILWGKGGKKTHIFKWSLKGKWAWNSISLSRCFRGGFDGEYQQCKWAFGAGEERDEVPKDWNDVEQKEEANLCEGDGWRCIF